MKAQPIREVGVVELGYLNRPLNLRYLMAPVHRCPNGLQNTLGCHGRRDLSMGLGAPVRLKNVIPFNKLHFNLVPKSIPWMSCQINATCSVGCH